MRPPTSSSSVLALVLACSPLACGHEDAEGVDPSGGTGDPTGDESGEPDVPVLAAELGVDLDQVASFVAQDLPAAGLPADPSGSGFRAGGENGAELYALTLDGEAIAVSLVEGGTTGGFSPPPIRAIHGLPGWVLFETWGYTVYSLDTDPATEIPCNTIAARRSDGALFCSELGIRSAGDNYGNRDPGVETALADATGELLYITSTDELADIMYRVAAPGFAGLTATWIESIWRPRWRSVNAAGDLLVDHLPAGVTEPSSVTEIYPADGGPATEIVTAAGIYVHRFGIAGERGAADQDDFYLLEVANDPSQTRLRVFAKQAEGFAETEHPIPLLQPGCGFLHPLVDGTYVLCNGSLVRVVEDGQVLAEPVEVAVDGLAVLAIGGLGFRFADQQVVFVVDDGTTQAFLRHDGIDGQLIPYGDQIELLGFSVSRTGDIAFIGVTIDTHERVLGVVPADADAVEILAHDAIVPASVVAFAPI